MTVIATDGIITGTISVIGTMVILSALVEPIITDRIIIPFAMNLETKSRDAFIKQAYAKYDSLSYQKKCEFPASTTYKDKVNQASNYVTELIWIVLSSMELMASICGTIIILSEFPMISAVVVGIVSIAYWFISGIMSNTHKLQTEVRRQNMVLQTELMLLLPMFQSDEVSATKIADIYDTQKQGEMKIHKQWMNVSSYAKIPKPLLLILLLAFPSNANVTQIVLIISAINSVMRGVRHITYSVRSFQESESKYKNYEEFWQANDQYRQSPAQQYKFPETITIEKFESQIPELALVEPITIHRGDRILIRGPTGEGKTTFVNAFLGKISGMKFDARDPENYADDVVEFYQDIRERMPFNNITVRKIFGNGDDITVDTDMIEEALHIACIDELIEKLDVDLDGSLSGGEKCRLALATRIYKLLENPDISILLLDESDQGVDPPMGYRILSNVLQRFPNTTTIVISHLERIREKFEWDARLWVNNKRVTREPA
jgi:ABC-type transport system involved in cytochrome bd biosynthesis fused ATPase/permease subunit